MGNININTELRKTSDKLKSIMSEMNINLLNLEIFHTKMQIEIMQEVYSFYKKENDYIKRIEELENELRKIKDTLPDGSMHRIADELGLDVETVRNYFGGANYAHGKSVGLHIEQGPNGGIVLLDDTTILEKAQEILQGH